MDVEDYAELDRILEQVELLEPETSPELVGAVGTPTKDATVSAEGLAPREGGDSRLWNGGDSCQGSSPSL